ncbi:M28 family metallopeptidase [Rugamonas sp.]|uniref:M28 family metallopeptidase n=1 Tax=Rugamonas sp. TaxID=1926287 RepID=UPI0026013BD7|nr:M28 family metallopeptidase [Rugamonas sp.]
MTRIPTIKQAAQCGRAAALAWMAAAAHAAPAPPHAPTPPLDPARIAQHVMTLASDAFQGRAPATDGEQKTIAYLSARFGALGLQPGGDVVDNARLWTQQVALTQFDFDGPPMLSVSSGDRATPWQQGVQIALRPPQTGAAHVMLKDAPLVFAGYGIRSPERGWDDFKGLDLHGKIALVLINDPGFENGAGEFGGTAMSYYGRWTYKYEEAARRGAAGLIIIHETAPASYGWQTVKNSNTGAMLDIVRDDPAGAHVPLEAWIQRDSAVQLMRAAGLDFEALKKAAQRRDFAPVPLDGVTLSLDCTVRSSAVLSHNIVAVRPGVSAAEESVLYAAHWDHLGIGAPDAKGERIYNGALDNAAGVALMLEMARRFSAMPQPRRSVIFLSATAEESGLLGSEYYAAHPRYALARTAAVINLDTASNTGRASDFSTAGERVVSLQDDLAALGRQRQRRLVADPQPAAGLFFRSDQLPFARHGVPAIFFLPGTDLLQGGTARGNTLLADYFQHRYHQPGDKYTPDWDLRGAADDGALLFDLGYALANSRAWPQWQPRSEFRAERDRSAAQRRSQ